ncbi:hypothetical protein FKN01_31585 [Streptomyces sp. 130]|uniref:hypothetical protein n=1 Tax=Streptomyces sp. 130 TaxID=2591006 RepID=UPI00117E9853|nr:hypothetical protein [Streptomyces sp. 130]TRV71558.1 hypothetical protein FKN01_31585 [Streptomyces sp. 130]
MNAESDPRSIVLMGDYGCHALWLTGSDAGDVSPGDARLGLSAGLAERLAAWADQYDATLDRDDPIMSGFPSREAEERFARAGELMAQDLARELGSAWRVTYYDTRSEAKRDIADS